MEPDPAQPPAPAPAPKNTESPDSEVAFSAAPQSGASDGPTSTDAKAGESSRDDQAATPVSSSVGSPHPANPSDDSSSIGRPVPPGKVAALVADSSELRIGDTCGGYVVQQKLGAGGFGTVYLAEDPQLKVPVAIKLPNKYWDATEARTLELLDHPNIVRVKHIGKDETRGYFVVMPFVPSGSLADRLKTGQRPSATDAACWIAKLARALHHAHERNLVHRDVKPANILFSDANEPLIADFGLALHRDQMSLDPNSSGTRKYQSPEQVKRLGSIVDARSDIYSLGVVFYELLAGVPPYRKDITTNDLQKMILEIPAPPIRTHRADVPAELERICLKMLEKKPSDRPTTALDVADELERFLSPKEEIPKKRVPWLAGVGLLLLAAALPTSLIYFGAFPGRSGVGYIDVELPDDDPYIPSNLDLKTPPAVSPDMADFRIENQTGEEIVVCMQKATRMKGVEAPDIFNDAIVKSQNEDPSSHRQRMAVDYTIRIPPHSTELRDKLSGSGWYVFHVRRLDAPVWQPYRDKKGQAIGIHNVLAKKFTKLVLTIREGDPSGTYHWEFQESDTLEY
jgi:serine/threonine protein kinase